jgi:hypothetical protein
MLVACGAPDTSAPEKTALAFFKAYQARDNGDLKALVDQNFQSMSDLVCNGSVVDCVGLTIERPAGFDFKAEPTVRIIEQQGTTANVETRHLLSDGATTRIICVSYNLQQTDQQWLVDDLYQSSICHDDATATAIVMQAEQSAQQTARVATSQANQQQREATTQAIFDADIATAAAKDAAATATQQAIPTAPPETFLTARQALIQANLRPLAQRWSADAMLIFAAFDPDKYAVDENEIALDGTSRVWVFRFASPQLQKTITYYTRDGFLLNTADESVAEYKKLFAGKTPPSNIALEQTLDSDQAAIIAREHGVKTDDARSFRLYLSVTDDLNSKPYAEAGAYWSVFINNFLTGDEIVFRAADGEIVFNDQGEIGSPGTIPAAIAPVHGQSQPVVATPTATSSAGAGAATDEAGILAYFTKNGADSTAGIMIDKVEGDYARIFLGAGTDAATVVYLKRENAEWVLVTSGNFFPPEELERLGIPQSLWI